jgi:FkbM family methyltransferase
MVAVESKRRNAMNFVIKRNLCLIIFFNLNLLSTCHALLKFQHPREALDIVKKYLPENPVIFEAGAYDGNDTTEIAKFWPQCTIHAFEPIPELYRKLVKNTHYCPRIHTYELAVSDSVGTARMYVSEEPNAPNVPSQSSSLLAPKEHLKYSGTLFKDTINVQTTTIDAWAEKNNIDHIDFMWLDMQGYELNALMASPNIMSTVKAVLTEIEFVEAYEGQYLFKDLRRWFESQGFELIAINNSYGWFGDALFVRK